MGNKDVHLASDHRKLAPTAVTKRNIMSLLRSQEHRSRNFKIEVYIRKENPHLSLYACCLVGSSLGWAYKPASSRARASRSSFKKTSNIIVGLSTLVLQNKLKFQEIPDGGIFELMKLCKHGFTTLHCILYFLGVLSGYILGHGCFRWHCFLRDRKELSICLYFSILGYSKLMLCLICQFFRETPQFISFIL